jgi:hypothetical protein
VRGCLSQSVTASWPCTLFPSCVIYRCHPAACEWYCQLVEIAPVRIYGMIGRRRAGVQNWLQMVKVRLGAPGQGPRVGQRVDPGYEFTIGHRSTGKWSTERKYLHKEIRNLEGCVDVGFEVFTAVVMKSSIFWDIMPCSPLSVRRCFGGTYRLNLQGRKNKLSMKRACKLRYCSRLRFAFIAYGQGCPLGCDPVQSDRALQIITDHLLPPYSAQKSAVHNH